MGKHKSHRKIQHHSARNERKLEKSLKESGCRKQSCDYQTAIKIIRELLDMAVSESKIDKSVLKELEKYPPIIQAVFLGCEKALTLLLLSGENTNVQTWDGRTPLIVAIERRHSSLLPLLLNYGADPTVTKMDGTDVLMTAVMNKDIEAVGILWSRLKNCKNYSINRANMEGHTSLTLAVENCWTDCVRFFLDQEDLDTNKQMADGKSALMLAVCLGHINICRKLLVAGSNILTEDNNGATALCFAIVQRSKAIIGYIYQEMNSKNREAYIKRRIELLRAPKSTCRDVATFYKQVLLHVILEIRWSVEDGQQLLYQHGVFFALMKCADLYNRDKDLLRIIFHLSACLIYDKVAFSKYIVTNMAEQFIEANGPDAALREITLPACKSNLFLRGAAFLPVHAIAELGSGRDWIAKNYFLIVSYLPEFRTIFPKMKHWTEEEKIKAQVMFERFEDAITEIGKSAEELRENAREIKGNDGERRNPDDEESEQKDCGGHIEKQNGGVSELRDCEDCCERPNVEPGLSDGNGCVTENNLDCEKKGDDHFIEKENKELRQQDVNDDCAAQQNREEVQSERGGCVSIRNAKCVPNDCSNSDVNLESALDNHSDSTMKHNDESVQNYDNNHDGVVKQNEQSVNNDRDEANSTRNTVETAKPANSEKFVVQTLAPNLLGTDHKSFNLANKTRNIHTISTSSVMDSNREGDFRQNHTDLSSETSASSHDSPPVVKYPVAQEMSVDECRASNLGSQREKSADVSLQENLENARSGELRNCNEPILESFQCSSTVTFDSLEKLSKHISPSRCKSDGNLNSKIGVPLPMITYEARKLNALADKEIKTLPNSESPMCLESMSQSRQNARIAIPSVTAISHAIFSPLRSKNKSLHRGNGVVRYSNPSETSKFSKNFSFASNLSRNVATNGQLFIRVHQNTNLGYCPTRRSFGNDYKISKVPNFSLKAFYVESNSLTYAKRKRMSSVISRPQPTYTHFKRNPYRFFAQQLCHPIAENIPISKYSDKKSNIITGEQHKDVGITTAVLREEGTTTNSSNDGGKNSASERQIPLPDPLRNHSSEETIIGSHQPSNNWNQLSKLPNLNKNRNSDFTGSRRCPTYERNCREDMQEIRDPFSVEGIRETDNFIGGMEKLLVVLIRGLTTEVNCRNGCPCNKSREHLSENEFPVFEAVNLLQGMKEKLTFLREKESGALITMAGSREETNCELLNQRNKNLFYTNLNMRCSKNFFSKWHGFLEQLAQCLPSAVHELESETGVIRFSTKRSYKLRDGSFGTYVGLFSDGTPVVVKSIECSSDPARQHLAYLRSLSSSDTRHPCLTRIYDAVTCPRSSSTYVIRELCESSLPEYMKKHFKNSSSQGIRLLISQLVRAIAFLHERPKPILHGSLKPTNVLITTLGMLKLSDYGLFEVIPHQYGIRESGGDPVAVSENELSGFCWRSQEVINAQNVTTATKVFSCASDVQVAGMLIYFILTSGKHPFGKADKECQINISAGQYFLGTRPSDPESRDLVQKMIIHDPCRRPTITEVARHPAFWSNARKFKFLLALNEALSREMRNSTEILNCVNQSCLEARDWVLYIEARILYCISGRVIYKNTVVELLHFAADLYKKYSIIPHDVKKSVQDPAQYILNKFPTMFMCLYNVVQEIPQLQEEACLDIFFWED